jgi:amino acid transporter
MFPRLKRLLLGSPLRTAELHEQRLSKKAALTVFASDNLSSNAYATEEILLVLVGIGALAADPNRLKLVVPIAATIAILLTIVVLSYGQLIRAFPGGGGTYEVAKDNLGVGTGLVAAAALLIDYILTVAVSVAAGVAALTSAVQPLLPWRNTLCVVAIGILTVMNLRGARESARVFAFPVYTFLFSIYGLILVALYRHQVMGIEPSASAVAAQQETVSAISAFIILRAFAHGCVALTGVEAVADGVQALKEPVVRNAQITLYIMAAILASLFLGLSYLAFLFGVRPTDNETVVSQIAGAVFGKDLGGTGVFYYLTQFSTTAILILAANTSYAGFPRLASILARDRFVPRQLSNLGDRLVFSNGIVILGSGALVLILFFGGNVHALIPLYAIGVFLSFTLAQAGLVIHWWKSSESGSGWRLALNALGAFATGAVLVVIAYVKFLEGAWIVVFVVPVVMFVFWKTRRHYFEASRQLSLSGFERPRVARHTVIIPVPSTPNRVVLTAVEYANSISKDVIAVYVNTDGKDRNELLGSWKKFVDDVPLIILDSPYRSVVRPLLQFIDEVEDLREDDKVTVLLPEFVPDQWWHNLLHNQTSLMLKGALLFRPGIIVTSVPHHLGGDPGQKPEKAAK